MTWCKTLAPASRTGPDLFNFWASDSKASRTGPYFAKMTMPNMLVKFLS